MHISIGEDLRMVWNLVIVLKYDKEWILKNSPKRKSKGNNHKIDWKQRDKEVLALCKNAVSDILKSEGKPQRASKALIGRMIGKGSGWCVGYGWKQEQQ